MCHPKLPKKLYNRLIINLDNLFVQKCDEVKMPEPLKGFYVLSAVPLVVRTSRRKANGVSPKGQYSRCGEKTTTPCTHHEQAKSNKQQTQTKEKTVEYQKSLVFYQIYT
jgi:hypothetical protein